MHSGKWAAPVLGLGAVGFIIAPSFAQTFIGNPTQANGWSTTSGVSIVAHSGEAGGRVWQDVINGAGMDFETGMLHAAGNPFGTMGMGRTPENGGTALGSKPGNVDGSHWIEFAFDQPYTLGNLFIWNWNEDTAGAPSYSQNFGMKNVTIEVSSTGSANPADWTTVFSGILAKAPGTPTSATSVIDLDGVTAQYVTITAALGVNQNWSNGAFTDSGLSEVRFAQFDPSSAVGWKNDASGDWNLATNWRQGFAPSGAGATALFGDRITAPRTVYSDTAVSVSTVTFDCNSSYQLAGQGTLSMVVASGTAVIDVLRGNHKINLPLELTANTDITTATGATLRLSDPVNLADGVTVNKNGAGTVILQSTLNAAAPAVVKINGGVVNFDAANNDTDISVNIDPATVNLGANQTLGAMTLSLGGNALNVGVNSTGNNVSAKLVASSLTVTGGGAANTLNQPLAGNTATVTGNLQIDAASKLVKQGAGVLRVGGVAIDSTGQLDLTDGKMIVDYDGSSPLAGTVLPALVAGRNNGAWNGNGITSSTAAADPAHLAIGYAEASDLGIGSFGGETVDSSTIVLRTTYKGDASLDGVVDSNDFNALVAGFGLTANALWVQGDFDYDGKVNTLDFNDLAGNFGAVAPAPALGSVVPEPASLGMVCLAGLLIRRRR